MEITFVADRFSAEGGGCERYLVELATAAARTGWVVRVLCRQAGEGATLPGVARVRVFAGPAWRAEPRLRQAVAEERGRHPERAVLAVRPVPGATHYQLHTGLYRQAFAAERDSTNGLRRLLYWPALRLNPRRTILLGAEREVLRRSASTRLMVFSEALARELVANRRVPAGHVRVSRPGVDLARFHPRRETSNPPRTAAAPELACLFVGHDFALKGLDQAITALAELNRGGVRARLRVAGAGPGATFARAAARAGLAKLVSFLGGIHPAALAEEYRGADVLVHPTFYDPFSRVVVEALASGCPVVTTRTCGAAELIEQGREGLLIDHPRDLGGLTGALASLADAGRRAAMGRAAAALGQTMDFTRHAAEVLDWLSEPILCPDDSPP
ncbi:MAG: glycosyltransferase family 4 protein [Acidobacteriota bacterium]